MFVTVALEPDFAWYKVLLSGIFTNALRGIPTMILSQDHCQGKMLLGLHCQTDMAAIEAKLEKQLAAIAP